MTSARKEVSETDIPYKVICQILAMVTDNITEHARYYQNLMQRPCKISLSLDESDIEPIDMQADTIRTTMRLPREQLKLDHIIKHLAADPDIKHLQGQRVAQKDLAEFLQVKIVSLYLKGGLLYDRSIEGLSGSFFPETYEQLFAVLGNKKTSNHNTLMFHWFRVLNYEPWLMCSMAARRLMERTLPKKLSSSGRAVFRPSSSVEEKNVAKVSGSYREDEHIGSPPQKPSSPGSTASALSMLSAASSTTSGSTDSIGLGQHPNSLQNSRASVQGDRDLAQTDKIIYDKRVLKNYYQAPTAQDKSSLQKKAYRPSSHTFNYQHTMKTASNLGAAAYDAASGLVGSLKNIF
ncbi:MAG: hypothetical protein ABI597_08930 [Gammaproteobacteria bacterium]